MAYRHATADDLPPEFASTDPALVAWWLAYAQKRIGLDAYQDDASEAHALMTAHHLKSVGEGTSSDGAAVTERKVGDVSEKYAVAPSASDLSSTGYGRAFEALRKGVIPGPVLTL